MSGALGKFRILPLCIGYGTWKKSEREAVRFGKTSDYVNVWGARIFEICQLHI